MTTKGLDILSSETDWGFKGKNYLFIIGIDQYKHWPPLRCAVKDVQDFTGILTNRYQFEKKDVTLLKDEEATEKNILAGFKQLAKEITEEDNLVIYFSGHGHFDEITQAGYWIPVDAGMGEEHEHQFIDNAVIRGRLAAIRSLHTFLIVDACFSGTLISQIRAAPRSERYKSRIVFTSGRREVVNDGPEGGNSPFAMGILNYLRGNTEKYIRSYDLIQDVKDYVEREAQQTPVDARLINADDQGGDFVFYLKMSEAEIWADVVRQHTKEAYKKFMEQFPESGHVKEAEEAYDWLTSQEENSVESLQAYLNEYLPDGKYVPEAMKRLNAVEEEQIWAKAKRKNTLTAYYEYLIRYPEGEHAKEAKKEIEKRKQGGEDEQEVKKAVEKKVHADTSAAKTVKPPDEEKAWENAREAGTYIAYQNFIQAYPESRFKDEAHQEMKRLDDIALNRIRLTEHNRSISLQEKLKHCLDYFNGFPGAGNNKTVKQIKDRLEIQKFSLRK